jgi:hypothetical protein
MKHNVHIYAVVRVKVADVEADTPEAATERAEAAVDLHALFRGLAGHGATDTEYAEAIDSFVVDVLNGDGQRVKSVDVMT